jgi:hypothetical protein
MNIQPNHLKPNSSQIGNDGTSASPPKQSFSTTVNAGAPNGMPNSAPLSGEAALKAIGTRYSRESLGSADGANALVREAADHLAQHFSAGASVQDREAISRWIQQDPLMRQQILAYFESQMQGGR